MTEVATFPSIHIPSSNDLYAERCLVLDLIAASGQVDDIITLCKEGIENNGGRKFTVPLPRMLTPDQYACVSHTFRKKGWSVRYSFLSWLTSSNDTLVVEDGSDSED